MAALQAFRQRPGDVLLRKELSLCYDNFTAYLDEVNPILSELSPEQLATVKDHRVDSKGRPVLDDRRASPAGWVSAAHAQLEVPDRNDNNTRAAQLLLRLAEVDQLADAQVLPLQALQALLLCMSLNRHKIGTNQLADA